ncbi:hypothetical protein VNI00_001752 [Paramarasmius palmivorus]|uniref:GH16 domain-containing protein n=1 Tax=Paramarasmius palmivorus TaxID=297713 RepID=A0AAW0E4E3_9AGAR
MSVAPSPRGDITLQPYYFTSSLYVMPFRDDISGLIHDFHECYSRTPGKPFALFKEVWRAQGWEWMQFKVFDPRSRETFLNVSLRLFLERTVKTEAPFTRVVALFGLYTFFNTQPSGSAPRLHSVNRIPIPFDHYNSLLALPSALTSEALAPLQPSVTYILDSMVKAEVFHLLPSSDLGPLNPRSLPREIYLDETMLSHAPVVDQDGSGVKRGPGRPTRRDKVKKAKLAGEHLERWLNKTSERDADGNEIHYLLSQAPQASLSEYQTTKDKFMHAMHETSEPEPKIALDHANREIMERVKEAQDLISTEEQRGSTGIDRLVEKIAKTGADGLLSLNDSRYATVGAGRRDTTTSASSVSDKFSLSPDPANWGTDLSPQRSEPDDYLHNPDPRRDRKNDSGGTWFTSRGFTNLGCLLLLGISLATLFAGYPMISYFTTHEMSFLGGFNLGGINASGQVPSMPGNRGLIDIDTPQDAYTHPSFRDKEDLQLVFSDEFNQDGRTFYPGDDAYWEAVDLHYWGTNNMEWYDPEAITTENGSLKITLSRKETHDLHFQGGMMSTWNKFCFTGGLIVTAVVLPGINNVVGLWPAVWTMGNLGRAGFGASLEGMWPYTYDACDVGTAPNQTVNGLPLSATVNGDPSADGALSYLPGQRLSRCTCPGESHPGPVHEDGTYVGRAAPEVDIFEAQANFFNVSTEFSDDGETMQGEVSQSGQWAPFNQHYEWFNTSDNLIINNPAITRLNSYTGGALQQATSGVSKTNQECYYEKSRCFAVYGFEYKPGYDDSYITWINDNQQVWTINSGGVAADTRVEISARPVPQEPMYILANLGMSTNFGTVDLEHLVFPTSMLIDYVRVYQRKGETNIGCDPKDFPTQAYINAYIEAYTNPNLTTWKDDYKQPFPKSKLLGEC